MTGTSKDIDYRLLLKNAYLELTNMRSELDAIEQARTESIAIVGMGCRFPGGANNPEAFWHLLREGTHATQEVPSNRWDIDYYYDPDADVPGKMYTRYGGFLNEVDKFDPQFFGISPREATSMDPQQRLLLEVSWEALENASIAVEGLRGSQTGVFIGVGFDDYSQLSINSGDPTCIDAYTLSGNSQSIAVGRLSYVLGLQGPTMQLDTTCSSSLLSVHLACSSLRSGECNLAIAGGVNLMLSPTTTIGLCKLKALAPDGRCKSFDAGADGYVRGEGCGIIVLKRLGEAIADGDNILALIRGSAVNHDGQSNGLTAPSGSAQEAVIRKALENARVEPTQIQYVEAHGTGTSLGDPIEVLALGKVLGPGRSQSDRLAIGSVKTNIGHLEAAAGVASLMKVVLALQHKLIPPTLHLKQPNPYIPWKQLPIEVPTVLTPWSSKQKLRLAGVSSFGMSGTNVHVILQEASKIEALPSKTERPLHLLSLSAKSESALQELASLYQAYLKSQPEASLADVCFTANTGRSHFVHRLALVVRTTQELGEKLSAFAAGKETVGLLSGQVRDRKPPKIAFLFTGQGSQYINMGRQLYETQPIFRACLEQCNEILRPYLEHSLLEILYPAQALEQVSSLLDQTAYTQPALFAFEYALYQLWKSWGITPEVVMGHSVGEYVAATVAGVFSLEDGLKLIAHRGQLMQQLSSVGEMVSLIASEEQVKEVIAPYSDTVAIAAINGPESVVISGPSEDICAICNQLEAEGVKTKRLQVSYAFHSPLIAPMLAEFEAVANQVTYNQPQITLVSNVTGNQADENITTASYWVSHVRQMVRFATSMETLHQQGYEVFLEIGAKPILLGMGRQCLPDSEGLWLPSLRPGIPEWQQLLENLAQLYMQGVAVDWSGFEGDYPRQRVALPTYPFQRQRYWIQTSEQKYQQAESLSGENVQTPVTNFLEQGNTEQLVQLLQKAGNFSPEQIKLLPEMLAVLVREHKQHLIPDFIKDLCYETVWRSHARLEPQAEQLMSQHNQLYKETKTELGSWLIFADNQGIGQQLSVLLRSQQEACILVFPGTEYKQIAEQEFSINPALPENFQQLLLERVATDKAPWRGVVYLWSLDTVEADALTLADLEVASQTGCGGALSLVQSLISKGFSPSPTLWLVTKGSQRVGVESTLAGVAQSPLWGLGKVITNEHPEFNCTLVDLDVKENHNAQSLFAEICSHKPTSSETHIAFRNGQRYVNRLVRSNKIVKQSLHLKADATYLITGGLGEIGLLVAQWLVEHGAKYLVLAGRSQPDEAATATLRRLEAAGTQVVVIQTDVSVEEDVTSLLTQIKTSMPQLRGIIHTAGVVEDRLLVDHQWQLFADVFAPKVSGAWNLHTLTQDLPLDFFVLFSSVASILGPAGLANYAAANAFLDALAHYRRSLSLPGLSINWGPWSMVGMARAVGSRGEVQWATKGIKPIEPRQALSILENLLPQDAAQVGVVQLNWSKFLQQFSRSSYPSFVSEIAQQVQELAFSQEQQKVELPQLLDQIKANSKDQSQSLLITYLQEQIAKALGVTPSGLNIDEPLNKMGLDSLMIVELKNRLRAELEINIPLPKFLDGLSVVGLTKFVSEQLIEVSSISKASVAPTVTSSKNSRIRGEL